MAGKNGSAALAVTPQRQDYADTFLYHMFDALQERGVISKHHKRHIKGRGSRSYEMAESSDLLADWNIGQSSADANIKAGLVKSRARSRDMERNNDYVKKYLNMSVNNIMGPQGIMLQNRAKNGSGKPDIRANNLIEDSYKRWGQKGICTVDGRLSWHGVEKLTARGVPRDGEILVRKVFGFDNPWSFAVQLFEPDRLDIDLDGLTLPNGNRIRMGVEMDTWGRPVAYHLLEDHPGDYAFISGGRRTARVPASEIKLIYLPWRAEQTRGFPWLHSAAKRLHHLNKYEEAEVVASRSGASKMFFYKRGPQAETDPQWDDEEDNNPIQELTPGMGEILPKDWDVTTFDPTHPGGNYPTFVKAALQGLASGLDVSYVSLANNLEGVNFSSIRQGVLDERNTWRMQQGFFIEELHNWIFPDWLRMALLTDLSGSLTFDRFDRYNKPTWNPRGWEWVDPKKDAEAAVIEIDNIMNSRTAILAKKGLSFEDVLADLAREEELIKAAGLEVKKVNQAVATAEPVNEEDEDNAEN
jgi:lambda family phage portal protein